MPAPARRGGSPLGAWWEEAEDGAERAGAAGSERGGGRAGFRRSESSLGEGRRAAAGRAGRGSRAGSAPPPAARRALGTASPHGPAAFREEAAQAAAGARARAPSPAGVRRLPRRDGGTRAGRARRRREERPLAPQPSRPGAPRNPRGAPAPWRPGSGSRSTDFRKTR